MKGETDNVSPFLFRAQSMNGKFYHPAIGARLEAYFEAEDWDGLIDYLKGLSHHDFRMAGEIISMKIMVRVSDEIFWRAFYTLMAYHAKAFLMTMLKAVPLRKRASGFTLRCGGFLLVADFLKFRGTEVDRGKFVGFMIRTFCDDLEELQYLFDCLHVDMPRERLDFLAPVTGMAVYYLLFLAMRQLECDPDLLCRCCKFMMRKGDKLSFNMASVTKAYFDLSQVKGVFSLNLAPYQLGLLEGSYEKFRQVMLSI